MGLGLGELLLIFIVALIVFGPEKLPEIAGMLGRALYELRRASADITATFLATDDAPPASPPAPLASGRPCAACGAFVPSSYRFCSACGTDQETWIRPNVPATSAAEDGARARHDGDATATSAHAATVEPAPPLLRREDSAGTGIEAIPFEPHDGGPEAAAGAIAPETYSRSDDQVNVPPPASFGHASTTRP
jgi:TatA/E family protein of Tat protein translocase